MVVKVRQNLVGIQHQVFRDGKVASQVKEMLLQQVGVLRVTNHLDTGILLVHTSETGKVPDWIDEIVNHAGGASNEAFPVEVRIEPMSQSRARQTANRRRIPAPRNRSTNNRHSRKRVVRKSVNWGMLLSLTATAASGVYGPRKFHIAISTVFTLLSLYHTFLNRKAIF